MLNPPSLQNNRTNVVIQQNSCKLLVMDILMSETCWAHKKWNKIASDIKLVFYSSAIFLSCLHVAFLFRIFRCLLIMNICIYWFIFSIFWPCILEVLELFRHSISLFFDFISSMLLLFFFDIISFFSDEREFFNWIFSLYFQYWTHLQKSRGSNLEVSEVSIVIGVFNKGSTEIDYRFWEFVTPEEVIRTKAVLGSAISIDIIVRRYLK